MVPARFAGGPGRPDLPAAGGQIDWSIEIAPGESASLPTGKSASHYYAARETDAALLKAGPEREKMLFYRGIGSPRVTLEPRFAADGQLEIRNRGGAPIPVAFVFENRGGRMGYREVHGVEGSVNVDVTALRGDLDGLRNDLAAALVEAGLYEKEAQAMIATWRDSWFEEGMRVFYLLPPAAVNEALPLRITPAPKATARVFVGRVEVLAPAARQTLATAMAAGDVATLRKYGRFLDAYTRLIHVATSPAARQFLDDSYQRMQREVVHPSCAQ